jgi:tRNA (cytidine/uridine-2'-O-)-methyltransferase
LLVTGNGKSRHQDDQQRAANDQQRVTSYQQPMFTDPFHIVLVEPEIPPNTGNIARLCAATGTVLHLVGKLGFAIDDRQLKRAGLDYWHTVDVRQWPDLETLAAAFPASRFWYTSKKAANTHLQAEFRAGDFLVFGKETVGLPDELLARHPGQCIRIPIFSPAVRSLNLSTAAGIILYEALRQSGRLQQPPPARP